MQKNSYAVLILFISFYGLLYFFGCTKQSSVTSTLNETGNSPTVLTTSPSHIIFVWLENKGYNSIIGSLEVPYINSLIAQGMLFTNTYAITHPSYPNYIGFFAGTQNGVTTDQCINTSDWTIPDLYKKLKKAGKSFAWYSEDLPAQGDTICKYGDYVEKHNPTTIFSNVPATANKMFSQFPSNYDSLENVVCITPNLQHDMHNGTIGEGDTWVQDNLGNLVEWCKTNNSIFVIYFDESERSADNRIPVIAVGEHVIIDSNSIYYDHYNWTRTICSLMDANNSWTSNLRSRSDISNWLN